MDLYRQGPFGSLHLRQDGTALKKCTPEQSPRYAAAFRDKAEGPAVSRPYKPSVALCFRRGNADLQIQRHGCPDRAGALADDDPSAS